MNTDPTGSSYRPASLAGTKSDVPLRVEVLGEVRAWLGEEPEELALGPARQRAVFAILAARAGQPVPRGELIAGVWGDTAPASAAGNVHTYISGLRRALEPERSRWSTGGVLASEPAGYRLLVERDNLDLYVFRDLRRQALARAEAGDHRQATQLLDAALALWRGEAFAGVPGPFAERYRAHVAEERLVAVEARIHSLLALGEHAEAVAELSVLVREHPLRESMWASLITALYRGGRHAEALEGVTHIRNILREELGTEPGPAIRQLQQQLLAGDRPPAAPATELLSVGAARVPDEPFLGRERETAWLRGLVDDLLAGRGRSVVVEGEPGIGKTALLGATLAGASERGCHVVWTTGDEPAGELLARLDDLCVRAPLLVVVDDLHRADDAGLLEWQRLASATRRLPVLLVTACRSGAQLVPHDDLLRLAPLPDRTVDELVGRLIGTRPGPRLRALAGSAAGNPRCLREIVAALAADGAIDNTGDTGEVHHYWSSDALVAAMRSRLTALSPAARDVVRHAALLGVEFTMTEVSATMSTPPSDLVDAFDEAMAAAVVVEDGTGLAFRHPALRDAVHADVPVELHRKAAAALAGIGAPAERVAEQLIAGGTLDDWVADWLVAHHERLTYRAPAFAAILLTSVLDAHPRHEELLVARVRVLTRLGHEPEREARAALAVTADPELAAELRHRLAVLVHRRGDTAEAADLLADNTTEDTPWLWRERRRQALADFDRGDLGDLDAVAAKAERTRHVLAGRTSTGQALQTLWLVHSLRRDHGGALRHIDEALNVVRDPFMRMELLVNRMFSLQNLDRLDDADDTLRSARRLVRGSSLPPGLEAPAAVQHFWQGRWDDALVELGSVPSDSPPVTGVRDPDAARLLMNGVAALILAHRDGDALAQLAAVHRPVITEERECADFLLAARSVVAERNGSPAAALAALAPLLDPGWMTLRHQWLPDLARLAVDVGDLDSARAALAVCEDEASREVVPARAFAAVARCRALVDGDPDGMSAAAWRYRRVGRRVELAATLEDAAVLFAQAGRLGDARSAFADAVREFTALGATWDLRRAARRLRRFGVVSEVEPPAA